MRKACKKLRIGDPRSLVVPPNDVESAYREFGVLTRDRKSEKSTPKKPKTKAASSDSKIPIKLADPAQELPLWKENLVKMFLKVCKHTRRHVCASLCRLPAQPRRNTHTQPLPVYFRHTAHMLRHLTTAAPHTHHASVEQPAAHVARATPAEEEARG